MLRSQATESISSKMVRTLPLPGRENTPAVMQAAEGRAIQTAGNDQPQPFTMQAVRQANAGAQHQALQIIVTYAPPIMPSIQVVQGTVANQTRTVGQKPALSDSVVHELLAAQEVHDTIELPGVGRGGMTPTGKYMAVESGFMTPGESLFSISA